MSTSENQNSQHLIELNSKILSESKTTVESIKGRILYIHILNPENMKRLTDDAEALGYSIVQTKPGKFILWRVQDKSQPFRFRVKR